MKYILFLALLSGCASQQTCWVHPQGDANHYKDDNECMMAGDAPAAYFTGGLYAAGAAKRRYRFCMQSKGYELLSCGKS